MTLPSAEKLEREAEKLYLLDAEMYRRLGIPAGTMKPILPALEKAGFPKKDPLFGGRRYWPAVKAWLDKHNGLSMPLSQLNRENSSERPQAAQGGRRPRTRLAPPQGGMGGNLAG